MFEGNDSDQRRIYVRIRVAIVTCRRVLNTCCVVGCTKCGERDTGIHFYSIPAVIQNEGDKTRAKINRNDWAPRSKSSRVCFLHFISGSYLSINNSN